MKRLEKEFAQLQPQVNSLEVKLAELQSPAVIKEKLRKVQIEMDTPLSDDIVRLNYSVDQHSDTASGPPGPQNVVLLRVTR